MQEKARILIWYRLIAVKDAAGTLLAKFTVIKLVNYRGDANE
jgi:hypothetical protein